MERFNCWFVERLSCEFVEELDWESVKRFLGRREKNDSVGVLWL